MFLGCLLFSVKWIDMGSNCQYLTYLVIFYSPVYCDVNDLMKNLQINFDYWKAQEELAGKEQQPSQAIDNS